jgi:hypothetical protein
MKYRERETDRHTDRKSKKQLERETEKERVKLISIKQLPNNKKGWAFEIDLLRYILMNKDLTREFISIFHYFKMKYEDTNSVITVFLL